MAFDIFATVYNTVQLALIILLLYRVMFGKDDGNKLIKRAQKFIDIVGKIKRIGQISLIAEEILEVAISKKLTEAQFAEILKYVKSYVGDK